MIPPDHDGEFVAHMEDVLSVYAREFDPAAPVVCMDEQPIQLVHESRTPIPAAPGRPRRVDYEYRRAGTANVFMFGEPQSGWRQVRVTDRRTRIDWAYAVREVLDGRDANAAKVVLVMDNLNTHSIGSLYEAFPPAEARRLATRLEIHYTPKHGSWLNMAEHELAAFTKQCLGRRIGRKSVLAREAAAWMRERNAARVRINWRFSVERARVKLERVYPKFQN